MADLIGLNAKLYRGTAGSSATTEMTNVRNLTLNLEAAEADTSRRGSSWRLRETTLLDGSIEWEMIDNDTDADRAAIMSAFMNKTLIALFPKDKASGAGLDADWKITKFSRNEQLEDAIIIEVAAVPAYATRYPTWDNGS